MVGFAAALSRERGRDASHKENSFKELYGLQFGKPKKD